MTTLVFLVGHANQGGKAFFFFILPRLSLSFFQQPSRLNQVAVDFIFFHSFVSFSFFHFYDATKEPKAGDDETTAQCSTIGVMIQLSGSCSNYQILSKFQNGRNKKRNRKRQVIWRLCVRVYFEVEIQGQ